MNLCNESYDPKIWECAAIKQAMESMNQQPIQCLPHSVNDLAELRDRIAIAVMKGEQKDEYFGFPNGLELLAARCYAIADAMLAERAKRQQ